MAASPSIPAGLTDKGRTYLRKAKEFRESRWASIKMGELASQLTDVDIAILLPLMRPIAVASVSERLDIYTKVKAPPVIIENTRKCLARAERGSAPIEAFLTRVINKRKSLTV